MADVFISYARENENEARSLADLFVANGWTVFSDTKIRGGKDYSAIIEHELATARCVVVLWSSFSVISPWVKAEATDAVERNVLIPVLLENVRPPLRFRLIQTVSLVGWIPGTEASGLVRLVDSVADLLGEPKSAILPSQQEDPQVVVEQPGPASKIIEKESVERDSQKVPQKLLHGRTRPIFYILLAVPIMFLLGVIGKGFIEGAFSPSDPTTSQAPALIDPQRKEPTSAESIPLRVLLHGLIALVPANGPEGANHMTALLVDARKRPVGSEDDCFSPYYPTLKFLVDSPQECVDAGCALMGEICNCDLSRREISIKPDVEPAKQKLRRLPESIVPLNREEAGDFSYIVNMARPPLSQALDPRALENVPPSNVVARMNFPFDLVTACALVNGQDNDRNYIHPMGFRRLGDHARTGELRQAVAQAAVAKVFLKSEVVTLTISDFGGANPHHLKLKPGAGGHKVELANSRDILPRDAPCADGIARDFAFFYQLTLNPPEWADRYIPRVIYTQRAEDFKAPECSELFYMNVGGDLIFPMATFNP